MSTMRLVSRLADSTLSLERVKQHLVLEDDDDDALVELYRDAAVEHVENVTRRTILMSRYRLRMDKFSEVISARNPPIRAVESFTYHDKDGVKQSIDPSDLDINTDYEWLKLRHKDRWPDGDQIEIDVVAGYGAHSSNDSGFPYTFPIVFAEIGDGENYPLPKPLELATLLLTAHWYENREDSITGVNITKIPHGVESLIFKYRNYRI